MVSLLNSIGPQKKWAKTSKSVPVQSLSDGCEQLMLMHLEMAAMSPMCSNKIELLLLYKCVQLRKCFKGNGSIG